MAALAQTGIGGIKAKIVSRVGRVSVANAEVVVTDSDGQVAKAVSSDNGDFVIENLPDGDYLLMQRDSRKEAYPGYWEIGAGGSALRGEDPLTCIRREVREETGVCSGEFTLIGTALHESSVFHSFLCVTDWDKDAVTLQEGETTAFRWISEEEMLAFIRSDKAIPSQMKRFAPYLDTRR